MGDTKEKCPGVFLGAETEGGKPEICQGVNVGVSIALIAPWGRGCGGHMDDVEVWRYRLTTQLTIVFCPERAPKGAPN